MAYARKHEGHSAVMEMFYIDLGCSYKRYKHGRRNHYKPCPEDFTIVNYASIKTKEEKKNQTGGTPQ